MKNLLASLINSIEAIVSLLVLLFLFLGIFALLGTQLFGGKFPVRRQRGKDSQSMRRPRSHFDSFVTGLFTVFQVLVGSLSRLPPASLVVLESTDVRDRPQVTAASYIDSRRWGNFTSYYYFAVVVM